VYGRHVPELQAIAEPILREVGGEDTDWRWMQGGPEGQARVEIRELNQEVDNGRMGAGVTKGQQEALKRGDCTWGP